MKPWWRDEHGRMIMRVKVLGQYRRGFTFVYPDGNKSYDTCAGVEREIEQDEVSRFLDASFEYSRAVARFENAMNAIEQKAPAKEAG